MKPQLGKRYEIELLDHFSSTGKSPEQAVKMHMVIKTFGRCIAVSRDYITLSWFWENDTSENNDNIHIMKKNIINMKELK